MTGLIIWLIWIANCLIAGYEKGSKHPREQFKEMFDCDDIGLLTEYVSCKIILDEASIKLTQSVLLQSYKVDFKYKSGKVMIPSEAEGVLVKKGDGEEVLSKGEQTHYLSVV